MTQTANIIERHTAAFQSVRRTVVSIFMFAAVLTGLLAASSLYILQKFTQVEVDGKIRDLSALRVEHSRLAAQIADAESQRRQFMVAVRDPAYRSLISSKDEGPNFFAVSQEIRDLAGTFAGDSGPAVFLHQFVLRTANRTVEIKGEVRDVGPRSMTVLAQFAEALQALPSVQSVENPAFKREFRESNGFYSPFTIRLILR